VLDHVFIMGEKMVNHYTTDEQMIYHTWGKHVNHYTTDEHMI
jgi:hypothetical protein